MSTPRRIEKQLRNVRKDDHANIFNRIAHGINYRNDLINYDSIFIGFLNNYIFINIEKPYYPEYQDIQNQLEECKLSKTLECSTMQM